MSVEAELACLAAIVEPVIREIVDACLRSQLSLMALAGCNCAEKEIVLL